MGRRKIEIKQITDPRKRDATFFLRKKGLIKKAMELSILCGCQISLVIIDKDNKLYEYNSSEEESILQKYQELSKEDVRCTTATNADVS